MTISSSLPALVQHFFTERLGNQMQASPHTVAGYRDTFRLLLRYASEHLHKQPTKLGISDLDADMIAAFLDHVETGRGNTARSRNTRLAAIRSFFRFVAMNAPDYLLHCQRVLAIPSKRHIKKTIDFLETAEMQALLDAPDRSTWIGMRDHLLLLVALQTGLRASELIGLTRNDVETGTGTHVQCCGKGRKHRRTPLRRDTAKLLAQWQECNPGEGIDPLFPSNRGSRLSRDALGRIVTKYANIAASRCPSIKTKRISPHVLRHSTAMELLHSGVDQTVIALWLSHEAVETTQIYMHADLRLKERALARMAAPNAVASRFQPDDALLAYLEAL